MPLNKPLKNPFVSFTHAIRHCFLFLKSKSKDRFIPNPNYDPYTEHPVSIYCVHGTADRSESFNLLAQRLKNDIPSNIKGFHLVTFKGRMKGFAIENFLLQLREKIEETRDKNIILMGHSRGGLKVSDLGEALHKEGQIHVDAIIPIAAPFQGSWLARGPITKISQSVKEMSPGSDYLKKLNNKMGASQYDDSPPRYRFFGAQYDRIVKGRAYLPDHVKPDQENVTLYDRHGHLSILSSWRLRDALKDYFHSLYPNTRNPGALSDICEAPLPDFNL